MPGIPVTADIEEIDGKLFIVNRQEVTKAQLFARLEQLEKAKVEVEQNITLLKAKVEGLK